jgi:hypothetical protein
VVVRLTASWLLCVAAGTLQPFDFVGLPWPADGRLFQHGAYQMQLSDAVLNLLVFVPFGALVHHGRRSHRLQTSCGFF